MWIYIQVIMKIFSCTVRPVDNFGVMFLDEVVLGEEYFYGLDNNQLVTCPSSLTKAPEGYDSVVYLGGPKPGDCKFIDIFIFLQERRYDFN